MIEGKHQVDQCLPAEMHKIENWSNKYGQSKLPKTECDIYNVDLLNRNSTGKEESVSEDFPR